MNILRYALIGIAVAAGAQQKPVNFYGIDREIELGEAQARELDSHTTPLNNSAVTAYVNRVGGEMARQIPDSPFRYTVKVVKDGVGPQPVALPGGYIYVSAGMFTGAQSESEFAGLRSP